MSLKLSFSGKGPCKACPILVLSILQVWHFLHSELDAFEQG